MVKCCDCGFLSLRNADTWELTEADDDYRETGVLHPAARAKLHDYPICFIRRFDLKQEYLAEREGQIGEKGPCRIKVLHKERDCVGHFDWHQGFTPKEHREMMIEQAIRESHAREAERQREWQAEQARLADARHAEQLRIAEQHHDDNLRAVTDEGRRQDHLEKKVERRHQINLVVQFLLALLAAVVALVAAGLLKFFEIAK